MNFDHLALVRLNEVSLVALQRGHEMRVNASDTRLQHPVVLRLAHVVGLVRSLGSLGASYKNRLMRLVVVVDKLSFFLIHI